MHCASPRFNQQMVADRFPSYRVRATLAVALVPVPVPYRVRATLAVALVLPKKNLLKARQAAPHQKGHAPVLPPPAASVPHWRNRSGGAARRNAQ